MGWDSKDKAESTNRRQGRGSSTGKGWEVEGEVLLRMQHPASSFPSRFRLQAELETCPFHKH